MSDLTDKQRPRLNMFEHQDPDKPYRYYLNKETPQIMHIDLNSAFASAEQQAWPSLRGRPIGVTNRLSKECCVIAASYEAKALGIRVGTRMSEALALCPDFIMLETDPTKYTHMYLSLMRIMKSYSPNIKMKSIDEGIIDFHGMQHMLKGRNLLDIGAEIKKQVYTDLGSHMRINVGIGPNRFLAKMAASWHKPDGLDQLDHRNLIDFYKSIKLTDITGIADAFDARLKAYGVTTPMEFLQANHDMLRRCVFESINGLYWHERLRGYEIDDQPTKKGVVGRQWVINNPTNNDEFLSSCMHYLTTTAGMKLRYLNKEARGVRVWVVYAIGDGWTDYKMYSSSCYSDKDIWRRVFKIFNRRPKHMVLRSMGVTLYGLEPSKRSQLGITDDVAKADFLTKALDEINDFYGNFTVFTADTLTGTKNVKQKIPFGGTEYFELLLKRA